jgi:hypothetical protein
MSLPLGYGFAEKPVPVVLPPGMLIDRFGADRGKFFSPKGASFDGQALPYCPAANNRFHADRAERGRRSSGCDPRPVFGYAVRVFRILPLNTTLPAR